MKYQNIQHYSECQLVTLFNVLRYFGYNKVPELGTKEYEKMCLKYHCISGSCLNMVEAYDEYRLKKETGTWNFNWISENIPIELSVSTKKQGIHSILLIKCKDDKFLVTNYAKRKVQWLRFSQLENMKIKNIHFLPKAIKLDLK